MSRDYPVSGGRGTRRVLFDVDLAVATGRTVGLVGESGSGKTTLTRLLLGLERPDGGEVRFEGTPLPGLDAGGRRRYRHAVAAVFQNPYSSLDPRMRIWDAVTEQRAIERSASKAERRARAGELLEVVGLGPETADRYPHQLSGGQRQRVAIARALAQDPEVIVLDEPLSALDVSVSAQLVNLLLELQDITGVTYLFVGHDLRLVRHLCHDVAVMYRGRLVEEGPCAQVLDHPAHPYTAALVAASALTTLDQPIDDGDLVAADPALSIDLAVGCPYRARCHHRTSRCDEEAPPPADLGAGRTARCFHPLAGAPLTITGTTTTTPPASATTIHASTNEGIDDVAHHIG